MAKLMIALIRHGQYCSKNDVPGAQGPYPLNNIGRKQARKCARMIYTFSRQNHLTIHPTIFCSDVLRAFESAKIIEDEISRIGNCEITIRSVAALRERSLGGVTNMTIHEIESFLSLDSRFNNPPNGWKRMGNYRLPVPGAESLMSAGRRCYKFIQKTISQTSSDNTLILFVGHAGALRYSAYLMKILTWAEAEAFSMKHCVPIILSHNEDKSWFHVEGKWKVK